MKRIVTVTVLGLIAAAAAAQMPTSVPAGHPPVEALPSGHPKVIGGKGAIAIAVVQGTAGGPEITSGTATVSLRAGEHPLRDLTAELDAHGVAMLEDIPLMMPPLYPTVIVSYGGTSYETQGMPMAGAHARQTITVTVHESSAQEPDWQIDGWQVVVKPIAEGLQVVEMVSVNNPSDRAWLSEPDADGLCRSVVLTVPDGGEKVWVDGAMHDCCTRKVGNQMISGQPLKPGRSIFHLGYTLATAEGLARLTVTPPKSVASLRVFVPHELTDVRSEMLEAGEVYDVYGEPMRRYAAADLPADRPITLTVAGLPVAAATENPARAEGLAKMLAIFGVGVCVVAAVVVFMLKPGRAGRPASRR